MSEETTTTDDTMDAQLAEEPRQDTAGGSAEHGRSRRIVVADMGLVRGSPRPRPYGGRGQADCSRKGGEEQS